MNIFLDIDETLIGMTIYQSIFGNIESFVARPYLDYFLYFIFTNFDTVNIFTAGTNNHLLDIKDTIFEISISNITKKYNIDRNKLKFNVIKTRDNCTRQTIITDTSTLYPDTIYIKQLKYMFKSKSKYKNINKNNTIIIDDNITTFSKNYGNGIYIPEFIPNKDTIINDKYLLYLTDYLKKKLYHVTINTILLDI